MNVEPFSIAIPEHELDDLRKRIASVRFPKYIERKGWNRGISETYLTEVIAHWKGTYNWRRIEKELNDLHHFKTTISSTNIHFIHEKGKAPNSTPIILTHGWPDSFLRYTKLIPMLTDPERFGRDPIHSFDVIIPSLPGFGFSGYPKDGLINNETVADIWLELMKRLGYRKFMAGGGDIGSSVTRYLAFKHPEALLGIHLTDVGIIRELLVPDQSQGLCREELEYTKLASEWLNSEAGYMRLQATKPQTLAVGLSDSPVGLAAWLLEKFHSWRDLQSNLSLDEVITNIMIYWFNNNICTAAGIYYENSHTLNDIGSINIPTGICLFRKDILLPPKKWVEKNFDVIHWEVVPNGGHFTSMENPEAYAENLTLFLEKLDLKLVQDE